MNAYGCWDFSISIPTLALFLDWLGTWRTKIFPSRQETKDFSLRKLSSPRKKDLRILTTGFPLNKVLQTDHLSVEFSEQPLPHESPSALSSLLSNKQKTNDYQITGKKRKTNKKQLTLRQQKLSVQVKFFFFKSPFIYQWKKELHSWNKQDLQKTIQKVRKNSWKLKVQQRKLNGKVIKIKKVKKKHKKIKTEKLGKSENQSR